MRGLHLKSKIKINDDVECVVIFLEYNEVYTLGLMYIHELRPCKHICTCPLIPKWDILHCEYSECLEIFYYEKKKKEKR